MIKNYLKILLRQAYKHKGYILINVLGLTSALVCGIFGLAFLTLFTVSIPAAKTSLANPAKSLRE